MCSACTCNNIFKIYFVVSPLILLYQQKLSLARIVQKNQLRSPFRLDLNLRLNQVQLRCYLTVCYH